jgi:F-type H+-transporting ATPase subunit b
VGLLRVDPGLIIWLWITFGIILLVLRLTVWDTIIGGLDKRSSKIAADLDAARQAELKAGEVNARYEQTMKDAKAEAAVIIEAARVEAVRLREELVRASQEEARQLRVRAEEEIQRAREDAERALRGQVVTLSFSIADALLKRETATADNRAFVEDFAARLTAGGASRS